MWARTFRPQRRFSHYNPLSHWGQTCCYKNISITRMWLNRWWTQMISDGLGVTSICYHSLFYIWKNLRHHLPNCCPRYWLLTERVCFSPHQLKWRASLSGTWSQRGRRRSRNRPSSPLPGFTAASSGKNRRFLSWDQSMILARVWVW